MTAPHETVGEFRRVHRLSPLLKTWGALVALAAIILINSAGPLAEWAREDAGFQLRYVWWVIGAVLGGLVVALGLTFAVSQMWWVQTGYRLTPEEIEYKHGVLTKRVRTARYDRTQAVDVVEPLVPRLFGLAGVRVEVAGGSDSAIEILYLPRAEADALRAEVLARVAAKGAKGAKGESAVQPGTAPGENYLVPPIPIARSLAATAMQLSTLLSIAAALTPLITGLSWAAVIPVLFGALPLVWRTVDQSWRFNATREGSTINVMYGLANRRRQAMPLSRIHAVEVKQPLLWRPFGWWTVSVTSAGYGGESAKAAGTAKLLPVGTWEQAAAVIDTVGPLTAPELTAPAADYRTPPRARWVSPVDWRQQTATVRRGAAVVTFGRLTRRFQMVATPHIQELTYKQGPLQRALGIANVRLDLVPGAVTMTARDLEERNARELVDRLRTRRLPDLQAEPNQAPEPVR